jgi:hypothetical protein
MTSVRCVHSLFRLAPSSDAISTLSFRGTGFRAFQACQI